MAVKTNCTKPVYQIKVVYYFKYLVYLETGPVGPLCTKVEDEEHEVVVTKETCRSGTGTTGPICKKEVLKREKCHPTGMKPLCRRVVEEEYEEVVTREMCPPLLSGGSGCKRISQEKRGCKTGPTGRPYCS